MSRRIHIARVRDKGSRAEGARLLVDRLWPRGVAKASLHLDAWLKDLAPSTDLRQWFGHDPDKWDEFQRRYRAELDANPDAVAEALDWCAKGPVLLLFDAHDEDHNNAVVLRDYLASRPAKG